MNYPVHVILIHKKAFTSRKRAGPEQSENKLPQQEYAEVKRITDALEFYQHYTEQIKDNYFTLLILCSHIDPYSLPLIHDLLNKAS